MLYELPQASHTEDELPATFSKNPIKQRTGNDTGINKHSECLIMRNRAIKSSFFDLARAAMDLDIPGLGWL